ncbi:ComEA family DNA-binding protein [Pelodictyon phaeoclathratiforme]|jgi:competence protein ComEA|uniref:Helix-hairpin-helix DNA-binding class 1 n=1 Tax=Pelodictyon phaeoclathratiforme (strain DSM 5477 / BU-1) TaxID=324925 RepID=B4SFD8_PELPB|nr:helix-hairpin-helix domain-containing protein [Pelodictyon phaeoclathratiforme]ACF44717.1 Helix-hairpin-helix DNA-binding class 1 [Pelodictyon phaeoclathratiforme BU-1]MBV5290676.1 helix-hairpin-helix domain-containing protein [Pelodictyon phaeoclathratiforme]
MNPLEKLALKLSLTKAEISLVSILLGFLLLGGILKGIRSAEEVDLLVKKAETARYDEKEVDSLIALANVQQATVKEDVLQESESEHDDASPEQRTEGHRSSGKKVFNGTIAFNKASSRELQKIPGIGPVMAERLIAFRKTKGGKVQQFQEFLEVKGIGKKKLESLKKYFILD